jgi:hypothetical protein
MNRFWIIVFCLIIFSSLAFAQENGLIINADDLSFDKPNNLVEAKGSVEVIYKDVTVYGDHIIYDTSREVVQARNGFILNYEGVTFEGDALDYEIKNKKGEALKFQFTYENIELGGENIVFNVDRYNLRNAAFTTCDLEGAHYHVSARDIVLYPKYGWLVAYWGFFWLGRVPMVPVPTYIYDVMAEKRGERNLPPFPEISSNDEDGVFINERLAWHIRRELSGTYSINYATKKGMGAGAEANYIFDEGSRGNLRCYGNVTDGMWGGITHRLYFGEEIEGAPEPPFAFFAQPTYREYEFDVNLSYRERINYQRVSFYPDLILKKNRKKIFREDLKWAARLSLGKVEEEDNIGLGRGNTDIDLYWEWPEMVLGEITPWLSQDSSFYSNGVKWIKNTGGIDLRRKLFDFLSCGIGYLHYFSVDGQSPFNYEMYRFSARDRLRSDLFFIMGETGVGVNATHFVDDWSPEDIDYSLFFKLHCYNLVVQYRSLRREFNLGFSLGGG